MERERRVVPIEGIEIRESATGEPKGIAGVAAVYDKGTVIAGRFEERIAPGAFDDAIVADDVAGLFNHDPNYVLGRTSSQTMELRSDERGLNYEIPELPKSRGDVLEAIRRKDVRGNSFSFSLDSDKDEEWIDRSDDKKLPLRIIKRIGKLYDVGPVTFPAYEQTKVSARSMERAASLSGKEIEQAECPGCKERDERIAQIIAKRDELLERLT